MDPKRPGERDRVQAVVDRLIARRRIISLDDLGRNAKRIAPTSDAGFPSIEETISTEGLAETVAEEKADNIEYQRPAIQSLGQTRLRRLVCRIFDDLVSERYEAKNIATEFGLSKSTFSRFAGSRWNNSPEGNALGPVPDLWRNLAHILASHSTFRKAAKKAGVWRQVCNVISPETSREVV